MRRIPFNIVHPSLHAPLTALLFCLAAVATLAITVTRVVAADPINITIPAVDESQFPRVAITVSAEQGGLPIAAGSGIAVQVTEDGKPLAVDAVAPASDSHLPLALVFAIDTSGSMEGGTLASVQQSVSALIASLAPQDSAAVIGFADKVTVAQPLTTDKAALASAVAALKGGGDTALYDALTQSSLVASTSGAPRRAIILLTDGQEYGSVSTATRAGSLDAAQASGTLIYAIGVGSDVDESYLQSVAQRSGGKFFASPDANGVAAIYSALEQLLRSQIVVTVQSNAAAGSGEHTLSVRLDEGGVSATAQRTYASPPAAPAVQPSPTMAAHATVLAAAVAAPQSGHTSLLLLLAGGGLAAVLAGGVLTIHTRRRRQPRNRPWTLALAELDGSPLPAASAFTDVRFDNGHIRYIIEVSGLDLRVPLGAYPITIGSAAGCELVLPPSAEVAAEHARMWVRDGKPMLHHLAPGYVTNLNGAPARWASVSAADRVVIGPYTLGCLDVSAANETAMVEVHA